MNEGRTLSAIFDIGEMLLRSGRSDARRGSSVTMFGLWFSAGRRVYDHIQYYTDSSSSDGRKCYDADKKSAGSEQRFLGW